MSANEHSSESSDTQTPKQKFQGFVKSVVKSRVDPWAEYHLEKIPAELVNRHIFDPRTGLWTVDISIVKIEKEPFGAGAQRNVFRMKKIAQIPKESTVHHFVTLDWTKAPNYVAKCYIKSKDPITDRQKVFDDVQLQYEAEHWAEEFNKCHPPKKIHFIRCYVVEFPDRPDHPVFGVERFVDGTDELGKGFIKHNSNSGFVDDEEHRNTPQAFSAHSFFASLGRFMVVDVQGVGDLYTDPQIHSFDHRFGDSDLGRRGMALFFSGFSGSGFNYVVRKLNLPAFPLSFNERKRVEKFERSVHVTDAQESPSPLPPPFLLPSTPVKEPLQPPPTSPSNNLSTPLKSAKEIRNETVTREKEFMKRFSPAASLVSFSSSPSFFRSSSQVPMESPRAAPFTPKYKSSMSEVEEIEKVFEKALRVARKQLPSELLRNPVSPVSKTEPEGHSTGSRPTSAATSFVRLPSLSRTPSMLLPNRSFCSSFPSSSSASIRQEYVVNATPRDFSRVYSMHEEEKVESSPSASYATSQSPRIQSENLFDSTFSLDNSILDEDMVTLNYNLSEVHLELAKLEGEGRFSELDVARALTAEPVPDAGSCLFHICIAAQLGSERAFLALGRLLMGLSTDIFPALSLDDLPFLKKEYSPSCTPDLIPPGFTATQLLLCAAAVKGNASAAHFAAQEFTRNSDPRSILMYEQLFSILSPPPSLPNLSLSLDISLSPLSIHDPHSSSPSSSSSSSVPSSPRVRTEDLEDPSDMGLGIDDDEEDILLPPTPPPTPPSPSTPTPSPPPKFQIGDVLEVNYMNTGSWYPASILSIVSLSSSSSSSSSPVSQYQYEVCYTDGGECEKVFESQLRSTHNQQEGEGRGGGGVEGEGVEVSGEHKEVKDEKENDGGEEEGGDSVLSHISREFARLNSLSSQPDNALSSELHLMLASFAELLLNRSNEQFKDRTDSDEVEEEEDGDRTKSRQLYQWAATIAEEAGKMKLATKYSQLAEEI